MTAACLSACAAASAGAPPVASSGGISREADRTLPPIAPPRVRGAVTSDGGVALSWDPVGLEILTSYRVRRLERGGLVHVADVRADPDRELRRSGPYTLTIPGPPSARSATYEVTAIDRDGNESAAARVTIAIP
jgi:hypothetical protein